MVDGNSDGMNPGGGFHSSCIAVNFQNVEITPPAGHVHPARRTAVAAYITNTYIPEWGFCGGGSVSPIDLFSNVAARVPMLNNPFMYCILFSKRNWLWVGNFHC
jgi:hypothetical protein